MSSVTPTKPTSVVALTPKKPSLKKLAFDPYPLPNDPQAIENSSRVYHALISALEGVLDVQDEVKEVANMLTGDHQQRLDSGGFTFITKKRRGQLRNDFLRRRYEGPISGRVEDHVLSRAHNTRVDSIYRRVRRLGAVGEAIHKARADLRLIRHHIRVYDKHVPVACKTGEASGCCWAEGGESLWEAELQESMEQDEDMTEYLHKHVFTAVEEKAESDEGSSSDDD
ncbi:hypothetical protein V5O48_004779 [Marasmius crinis-equi]|uniref:Uncharacterized protein n=1 Tax=Marasmius crinis-equi TaxID=585013 RepID=A0ABR3FP51_9AGAR